MYKKIFIYRISQGIIIVLLPIIILLSIIQVYALNPNFYLKEFNKYNISENTKIEPVGLNKIVVKMVDYLKDNEKDLNIRVKIKGVTEEAFGEREKEHMVDVKKLFQRGYVLRNLSIVLVITLFVLLIKGLKNTYKNIYKSLLGTSLLSLAVIVFLFILIQIDFYKYFTYFHKIFFNNDLWLLNPKTDLLIQMLPLGFFIDIAIRVIGWFAGTMFLIGFVSFCKLRKVYEY